MLSKKFKYFLQPFFILVLIMDPFHSNASHITGGEMYYTTNGSGEYRVTMKLFMRCNSGRQFNDPSIVSIFNKGTGARVQDVKVNLTSRDIISITDPSPCISNPPAVCYEVGYYVFYVTLPPSADGYVLSSQVNFRID